MYHLKSIYTLCMFAIATSTFLGCARTPQDLEKWKNAKGGMEKMIGWVKSTDESMPVRKRAVEILVEKDEHTKLQQIFDQMKDDATRDALVDAAVAVVEKEWAKADFPTVDTSKADKKGGKVRVEGGVHVVKAKDAAYYFYPFAKGDSKKKMRKIMVEWIAKDHEIRTQLGKTTLGQILPYTGAEGLRGMMTWFETSSEPSTIARHIRKHADDSIKKEFANTVLKIANAKHPNLSDQMRVVVLETNDPVILPYLQRAIEDKKSPPKLVDDALDGYLRIQKAKATPYMSKLVKKSKGLLRWVAVTRIITLRGKPGVMQASRSLPLDVAQYETEDAENTFKPSTEYFCNMAKSELNKQGIKDTKELEELWGKLLEQERWPQQVLGIQCAKQHKHAALKTKVLALSKSTQAVPLWGDHTNTTVGKLAQEAARQL